MVFGDRRSNALHHSTRLERSYNAFILNVHKCLDVPSWRCEGGTSAQEEHAINLHELIITGCCDVCFIIIFYLIMCCLFFASKVDV